MLGRAGGPFAKKRYNTGYRLEKGKEGRLLGVRGGRGGGEKETKGRSNRVQQIGNTKMGKKGT